MLPSRTEPNIRPNFGVGRTSASAELRPISSRRDIVVDFGVCRRCADSNKKLKDALIEFSGDVGVCRQQDEVGMFTTTCTTTTPTVSLILCKVYLNIATFRNTSLTPDKEPNILIERLPVSLCTQELCTFKNGLFLAHPVEDF